MFFDCDWLIPQCSSFQTIVQKSIITVQKSVIPGTNKSLTGTQS